MRKQHLNEIADALEKLKVSHKRSLDEVVEKGKKIEEKLIYFEGRCYQLDEEVDEIEERISLSQ